MKYSMFRKLSIIVSILLCAALIGCSSSNNAPQQSSSPNIAGKPSASSSANISAYPSASSSASTNSNATITSDRATADYANKEEYSVFTENNFMAVADNPLSTFSADVDTASYANIKRMISDGIKPPVDAVRIEEMLNYFQYDYPEPRSGEPFSVTTEITNCPWNEETKLLLIGLQAEKVPSKFLPPQNLVFLLDVSGSMESPDKLPLMKRAFGLLTEQLRPYDRVSIVTYASSERIVLKGATGDEKDLIMNAIENLTAGGSTFGSNGIISAYDLAQQFYIEGGNNRVILGTDGDLNVGVTSESKLKSLIEEKRNNGVFLSVMGFGTGNLKDNKMETLADNGNGNYSYIADILEAKKVLVEEMGGTLLTVAKDVKFQVEFNPDKIKGYRLVGYENRLLNSEDFDDDRKDAGEIGAGHRVTALYEIVAADSDFEVKGSGLKYQQKTTGSEEWLTIKIRYKAPDQNNSLLLDYPITEDYFSPVMSDNLRLASSIAEFGMILRKSPYAGLATYDTVIQKLEGSNLGDDPYVEELISLVKKCKRLD